MTPSDADLVEARPSLRGWVAVALVGGIALVAAGWFADRSGFSTQFFRSYLVAWLYWVSIALGSLVLLLLHNLTGGAWGWAIRHLLLASASTLPLVAVLFLPIALGLDHLYVWADAEHVSHDPVLAHKAPYLNPNWFWIRSAGYFVVWLVLLLFLRRTARSSYPYETDAARRIRIFSGQGLGLSALAITFASFDWAMSLEPHWYSTIYGVVFLVSQGLAAFAFAIVALLCFQPRETTLRSLPTADIVHDLGKLLFAFTMIWAYVSFSQFLIIWYANIPEEVVFYTRRLAFGWEYVAISITLFHFGLPFVILLSREVKRRVGAVAGVAGWILFMRWVDLVWHVEPAFHREGTFVPLVDLGLTAVMGALWLANFTWVLTPPIAPPAENAREEEPLIR